MNSDSSLKQQSSSIQHLTLQLTLTSSNKSRITNMGNKPRLVVNAIATVLYPITGDDTLERVAAKFGVNASDILDANPQFSIPIFSSTNTPLPAANAPLISRAGPQIGYYSIYSVHGTVNLDFVAGLFKIPVAHLIEFNLKASDALRTAAGTKDNKFENGKAMVYHGNKIYIPNYAAYRTPGSMGDDPDGDDETGKNIRLVFSRRRPNDKNQEVPPRTIKLLRLADTNGHPRKMMDQAGDFFRVFF